MKISSFLGMALTAAMSGIGNVIPGSTPRLPVAPHMRGIPRQRRKKMERAEARREMNDAGRAKKSKREMSAFQQVVNTLTNHERNLWARAGYPGLRRLDVGGPAEFDRSASVQ